MLKTNLIEADSELLKIKTDFLSYLLYSKNFSPLTIASYERDLRQFFYFMSQHLGKLIALEDLRKLEAIDFRSFLAFRQRNGASARTNARGQATLRSFFKYLKRQNLASNSRLSALRSPQINRALPRTLSAVKAVDFVAKAAQEHDLEWVRARDSAILTLLYGSGLRISEALSLLGKDFNAIAQTTIYIKGKGRKTRLVPILPIVHEAILEYKKLCPYVLQPDMALFRGVRGKALRPELVQKSVRLLRNLLGLPPTITPHALRHSFASHLLQNGSNLRAIQELLGHSSLSSTQIYTNLDSAHLLTIYRKAHPRSKG